MNVEQGEMAPDFTLPADDGSQVRLSELRGRRVVLFFYPRADTPGCTTEACEFRDLHPRFQEQDAVVLGISPDAVEEVRKFRDKFSFPYRLLADADHQVAEAYGVWKERSMYGKSYWGVERSTFVIDEQGRIASAHRKVKPEGHAEAVLKGI